MKYTITYACGHTGVIDVTGKASDREWKLKNHECRLCQDCYKKKIEEEAKRKGFLFKASVSVNVDESDGSICYKVFFDGDTVPHKGEIKELGYRWNGTNWYKIIKATNLDDEARKAESLGAITFLQDESLKSTDYLDLAVKARENWFKLQEELKKIKEPEAPSVIAGHKWNEKFYGKPGNYRIYPDGNEVKITDEQRAELEEYILQMENYYRRVDNLKRNFD